MYAPLIFTDADFIGCPLRGNPCYTWFLYKLEVPWLTWWIGRGMETAGWISKGRSDVKNCASLSELFIAKWNTVTAKAIWSTTLTSSHFQAPLNVKRRSRFVMLYWLISVLHLLHRSNIMQSRKPRLCVCVWRVPIEMSAPDYISLYFIKRAETWSWHMFIQTCPVLERRGKLQVSLVCIGVSDLRWCGVYCYLIAMYNQQPCNTKASSMGCTVIRMI